MEVIYSGVFLNTSKSRLQENLAHSTWEFGSQAVLPVPEGQAVKIVVVGKYEDDDILADIVEWHVTKDGLPAVLTHQPRSKVPLHITREIKTPGIQAVESGRRAAEHPEKVIACSPYELLGTAGYRIHRLKKED